MANTEISDLIDKIRGTTPTSELQKDVEAVIKADEDLAKLKAEKDKKKLDDIKAAEKKLKKDAIKEEKDKKKKTGEDEKEKPDADSDDIEEVDLGKPNEATIKKLTEAMKIMSEEIAALKKIKNYRTKPPPAKKVDEVDDFIKQNITKDFEMRV